MTIRPGEFWVAEIPFTSGGGSKKRPESEYRGKPHLTDFEAFGEDDLHGESTAAPAG
jgi:hypothetical protein